MHSLFTTVFFLKENCTVLIYFQRILYIYRCVTATFAGFFLKSSVHYILTCALSYFPWNLKLALYIYAICIYVLGHYFGNQVTFRIAICGKITRLTEVYTTDPYCENQAKQGFTEKLPELDPVASSPSSVGIEN